ncbi:TonB-dependent receptor domain-containing protein [Vibrio navarrensis]
MKPHFPISCKVSLISLAVFHSLVLHASEQTDESVEVLGVRYAKPITVAKPAETIVDSDQIEEQQYANFAELVGSLPGATLDGGARSGGERINIRGFGDPSDIAVYVDGAPIGFQQYRYGTFFFDPFLIGETEVIKGAHDYQALNGKFGGVIRIKTKTVDDLLEVGQNLGARVSTGYNTNGNESSQTLSFYGRSDTGFYFLANGSLKDSQDVQVGGGETVDYSAFEQDNLLLKVGYLSNHHQLNVITTRYRDEGRKPWANRRGKMPDISDYNIKKYGSLEAAQYANTAYNTYQDNTTTLSYRYMPSNPYLDLTLTAARSKNERHWVRPDIAFEKMFVSVGNYGHESWLSYQRDYVDLSNRASFRDHDLVMGLQYEKTDRQSLVYNESYKSKAEKNYGWYTPYFEPSGEQSIYAVYVADHYRLSDALQIIPSLRYEYIESQGKGNAAPDYNDPDAGHDYSKTTHKGFSPRLEINYQASPSTLLNFSYAYALKAPTIDDLYSVQFAKASAPASARDLDVSRLHAYQGSVIQIDEDLFGDNSALATELTIFFNDISNNVGNRQGVNLDKESNALQSWNTNLDGYKIYGFELISQLRWHDFYSDFSASYARGKNKGSLKDSTGADEDRPNVPPLNINLCLGYEWMEGLRTGWKVRWYDVQNKTEPGNMLSNLPSDQYTLQDAYLNWDVKQVPGLRTGVVVKNLTDRYYEPYLMNGVPALGREIKLHLSYKY